MTCPHKDRCGSCRVCGFLPAASSSSSQPADPVPLRLEADTFLCPPPGPGATDGGTEGGTGSVRGESPPQLYLGRGGIGAGRLLGVFTAGTGSEADLWIFVGFQLCSFSLMLLDLLGRRLNTF